MYMYIYIYVYVYISLSLRYPCFLSKKEFPFQHIPKLPYPLRIQLQFESIQEEVANCIYIYILVIQEKCCMSELSINRSFCSKYVL